MNYYLMFLRLLTTLQTNSVFQKEAASSTLNKVPPTGAPKAAETPDAAPAATKSRTSWSVLNEFHNCQKKKAKRHLEVINTSMVNEIVPPNSIL